VRPAVVRSHVGRRGRRIRHRGHRVAARGCGWSARSGCEARLHGRGLAEEGLEALLVAVDPIAPFAGARGQNPFYAQALVSIGAGFVDVVTVPATADAPNPGDLTTATLAVLASCS